MYNINIDPDKLEPQNKDKEIIVRSKKERINKKKEFSESKIEEIILNSFNEIQPGIKLNEELFSRLKLIERYSEINSYSRMIASGVENMFNKEFERGKILNAKIAALIHDVGKSGPADATPEQQLAVVRLFAAESLKDEKQNIESAVREVFGEEVDSIMHNLEGCGIKASWSMREFWDQHITWGSKIIKKYSEGIPTEAIIIAKLHHAYKGPDNPLYNPDEDSLDIILKLKEASAVGILEEYLSVVIFDLYEAFAIRSGFNHQEAIEKVRSKIPEEFCSRYPSMCESINEILNRMSKMEPGEIFKGSKEII